MATPSFIGLQNHGNGDDVWFRNIQIKDLSAPVLRDSTTTAVADPPQLKVGRGSRVTVSVAAEGAVPTGEVQLKHGDAVLGSGTLAGGRVTIATGGFATPGTKTLTAVYAGDATTGPSSGTVQITVKASPAGRRLIRGRRRSRRARAPPAARPATASVGLAGASARATCMAE